jgi:ankyrin repeat protein
MKTLKSILVLVIVLLTTTVLSAQEIFEAVRNNNLAKVKELINVNQNLVNVKDETGRTPLHWAARGVHFEILKYLVEKGADVNAKDNDNIVSILSITSRNNAEALKYLLTKGAKIDEVDNKKETSLHYAAARGFKEEVKILIDNNAILETKNSMGRTPLIVAARERGGIEVIKLLVEKGANINVKDIYQDTPLSLAAWRGYEDIVNYLIEKNADIPTVGPMAKGLFSYALNKRLLNLYKAMLNNGADIKNLSGGNSTVLHWASKGGSEYIVRDLIKKNYDVNACDMYGYVPLHYAAKYGRLPVVKALVEKGAELNVKSKVEETPLNLAQKSGQKEVVDYLLSNRAFTDSAKYTKLKGKYFGMKEPGEVPALFAPGIATNLVGGHSNITFSPDGEEAFWTEWNETESGYTDGCKILHSKIENGFWTVPEVILKKGDTPMFSSDGKKIYFLAVTPQREIEYYERNDKTLSQPKPVPFTLDGTGLYWQFSFDNNQNLIFSGDNGLFRAQYKDGKYSTPEKLSKIYHPEYNGGSPFIAPDGNYIIFSANGICGELDLFIGYRKSDGSWTKPINLGKNINTAGDDHLPIISPDRQYLFFMSTREDGWGKYWVSAKFIEELRPKE